jgi:predicted HAD superfamily Cof-like phosphohydrolase
MDAVREFHLAFRLPIRDKPTRNISKEEQDLRIRLVEEETSELREAIEAADLVAVADALADLVYVAYGTALHYGIDLDAAIAEIHRSNMSKAGRRSGTALRGDGKVLKSPTYSAPNLRTVLGIEDED